MLANAWCICESILALCQGLLERTWATLASIGSQMAEDRRSSSRFADADVVVSNHDAN